MLKPLNMVFGVVLLLLFVDPASQILSEAEVFAQSVDTAWVRRYNGTGSLDDYAFALAVDDSGNVCVTGKSRGIYGISIDYATVKYYPNGDTAWVRRYDGPESLPDEAYAIATDGSGNVYVTGGSWTLETNCDYLTIKYCANGDTAWVRRYNGMGNSYDEPRAIAADDSGNVYVTGGSYSSGTDLDYATIKYYPNGDTAWVRRYNGPVSGEDQAHAIAVDDSSNVYVTGTSYGKEEFYYNYDYATIKYYPNGDTAWVRRYNGFVGGGDRAYAIAVDSCCNVYVTGDSWGSGTNLDYATIKYYPNGDTAWVRRYNGPGNFRDYAFAIAVGGSGSVYVTGQSYGGIDQGYGYATLKYYPNGDVAWVRTYNGPIGEEASARAIAVDNSENTYVSGYSFSLTQDDYATIKYYPNGDTAWLRTYDGPANDDDEAFAIAVDDSGNVYVTGWCTGSLTGKDYCTIKYVQIPSEVKDETGSRERPSEFDLSQNYPNPFNPTTKIEFTLAKSGFVTLQIYDVLGRKVRTLVSEELPSGYKSVIWDGKNDDGKDVASGVYFYQLKVGDFSEPKKMVLLK
jgi:hypothetical protein